MDPVLHHYLNRNYTQKKNYFKYCDYNIKAHLKKIQVSFLKRCLEEKVSPKSLRPKQLKFDNSEPFSKIMEEIVKNKIKEIRSEINFWFHKSYKQLSNITNNNPQQNIVDIKGKMKENLINRRN